VTAACPPFINYLPESHEINVYAIWYRFAGLSLFFSFTLSLLTFFCIVIFFSPFSYKCVHVCPETYLACCRRKSTVEHLQESSTMRLGPASSNTTVRLANTPDAMLLTRGNQQILLVNSTHTVLFGPDGLTSISLLTNETGYFVSVVADAVSSNAVSVVSGTFTSAVPVATAAITVAAPVVPTAVPGAPVTVSPTSGVTSPVSGALAAAASTAGAVPPTSSSSATSTVSSSPVTAASTVSTVASTSSAAAPAASALASGLAVTVSLLS